MILDSRPAPLGRQLGAILYDLFLILALMILVGFIFVGLNGGEKIPPASPLHFIFQLTLLGTIAGFFIYFWSAQGQTLGMRAWRLVLIDAETKKSVSVKRAWKRFFWAGLSNLPLGFGLWWRLMDSHQLTAYDRLSQTRLLLVDKNPYS